MKHESVQARFSSVAAMHGNKTAIARADRIVSYAELSDRANRLANFLVSAGVAKGTPVAIFAEDSIEVITAILGILKAGCIFVPLDLKLPANRLSSMVSQVSPEWFLTESRFLTAIAPHAASARGVICLDGSEACATVPIDYVRFGIAPEHFDTSQPQVTYDPDDACYVYFTSGSTGKPKGITGRLKGIDHFIRWEIDTLNLNEEVRVSQLLPVTFDGSLRDIFVPLCAGGTVCVPPDRETILDTSTLVRWLDDERVNVIHCVPSLFRSIINEDLSAVQFSSLRYILMAGEPLLPSDVGRWMDHYDQQTQLVNLYGTSETTMAKFAYFVQPSDRQRKSIPVGKPVKGAAALVVDDNGKPCPPGMIGEIYIRTPYRTHGYYNQPELTAQSFIQNPFSDDPDDIVCKTGDYGRVLEDGNFEYLGRRDNQVKVRGVRVELAEIENVFRQHAVVKDVAVIDREDRSGNNYLCAYVVVQEETGLELLKQSLAENLPDYMVPSAFIIMETLPRTITGKIDRRALPAPGQTRAGLASTFVAPRNAVEEMLAGIWAEVLGLPRVGTRDNFFELGGHSLLATQVASRVRSVFQIELPLRSLFKAPTVGGLAATIEEAIGQGDSVATAPIVAGSRDRDLPLSFAQQRLWFLHQLEPGLSLYNLSTTVRLIGALDLTGLEYAFSTLVRRHEALRTSFTYRDGMPRQVISPPSVFQLDVQDVSGLPQEERLPEAQRIASQEARQSFDLERGMLLRVKLLRLSEEEHVLVLVMHHIVSDGWSMGVLVRELVELYGASRDGRETVLGDLPIQYADFAVWQREWLSGPVLDAQLSYWREQLQDAPPLLELPTDRPRPPVQTHNGAAAYFAITAELTARIKELSRHNGVTLFMTLLAAFDVLLMRHTGQADIVVGSDIANRNRAETEDLIGFFVNMLVMRTDLSGNPTFIELLERVREVALEAYAHQDMPFEKLVEELQPERSLQYSPLFQVVLVLQNAPTAAAELPSLEVLPVRHETRSAKFDLTFVLEDSATGLHGSLEYNSDLFEPESIRRLLDSFAVLLEAVAANPRQRLSELSLLSQEQRSWLISDCNRTRIAYPRDLTLQQLFAQQVESTPNAIALVSSRQQLTYRELNERANRLARHLRALGVSAETPVVLCLERSPEMIVTLLAILKAGGYYVPLDPSYPLTRLSLLLEQSQAPVLVTRTAEADVLPVYWGQLVLLDEDEETINSYEATSLETLGSSSEQLCYCLYTSGSTGEPKSIGVMHRNVVRLLFGSDFVEFGPGEVHLQLAPLSFDASTFEVWGALLHGGRLALAEPGQLSLAQVSDEVVRYGITTLWLTAGLFHQMVDAEAETLSRVRQLLAGGDVLSSAHVRRVLQLMESGEARLVNGYGPTETTTFACCAVLRPGERVDESVPIGRPIANTTVYVMDQWVQIASPGAVEELYIGGDGVARGYLNRPMLTAERFVPDPFGGEPGARLYRTGDLVRYRTDGQLEFLGRMDHQVKVRGFRIELGEIEAALSSVSGVREAVVEARPVRGGTEKRLVAYVVWEAGAEGSVSELRGHLKERLPDYMSPSVYVELAQLPLTANGKVDRRALPEPAADGGSSSVADEAGRTPVEELLCGIWAEVLGVERLGLDDDFFELGGHSLLATQVVSRVRETCGVELALRQLFERPTVRALAVAVEAARRAGEGVTAPPMVGVTRERDLPLSFAQQRLWFLDQLEPNNPFYNIAAGVRLSGQLEEEALSHAVTELVRRHEVLRTSFQVVNGQAVQVIGDGAEVRVEEQDLSGLPAEEREAEVRRIAAESGRQPFELGRGPLLRVKLVRLSETEHVLVVVLHHIVSDGWSMGVLVRELVELYAAWREQREARLAPLPVQYADFAVWQRGWLSGEALARQLGYWRGQLAGAPQLLELPTDRPRPAMQTYRGARESFHFTEELRGQLRVLARREGATLFMVLLAAWQVLLWRYTGQEDIVVGSPIANRNRAETENLIGFFVNTLVLRSRLRGQQCFKELLKQVREMTLDAYAHQDVPFEKLVEELQPERTLSHSPLFQVMFTLQNTTQSELDLSGFKFKPVSANTGSAQFDMSLDVAETDKQIYGVLHYNTDLFDSSSIRQMLSHFNNLIEGIVAEPETIIAKLPLLSETERRQMLVDLNATAVEYSREKCLHEFTGPGSTTTLHRLFEQQVERSRHAVAVVCGGESVTYGELNERAERLAKRLRQLGVGAETLVGLLVERSVAMVVAILGVLKAGGAYVPLEVSYPEERMRYMVADAGLRVVVTAANQAERAAGLGIAQVVSVERGESDEVQSEAGGAEQMRAEVSGENLCYVIYTSGSTGRPKGVMVTHGNVTRLFTSTEALFNFSAQDVWTLFHSYAFDFSVWELWGALLYGGRLVVVPFWESRSPESLRRVLVEDGVTVLNQTPSAFRQFMVEEERAGRPGELRLRVVVFGGEALEMGSLRGWMNRPEGPGPRLVNMYGITETTVHVTYAEVRREEVESGGGSRIGVGLRDLSIYVLDEWGEVVGVGMRGELYIGGEGVARGYLQRPELTAERFIPDGFGAEVGARLYRTGDLARYRADGELEYLGRIDNQVKIRGYRIELGEIEAALCAVSGVREAVVDARPGPGGTEKRLVAYVVWEVGAEGSVSELRRQLKERLPDYMSPSAYVELAQLPLTANGKVDRRAFSEPEAEGSSSSVKREAGRTPVEELLCDIWAEVLGVEQFGVDDNFFDLGGHSLLATVVASRIRERFFIEFQMRSLFESPTISALAVLVEKTLIGQATTDEISAALERLDQLSNDDIKTLLLNEGRLTADLDAS